LQQWQGEGDVMTKTGFDSDRQQPRIGELRPGLALAFGLSVALNLLMLAVPLYSMQLFDRVLPSGSVETLLLLTIIAGFCLTVLGALEALRMTVLARLATRIDSYLAPRLLAVSLTLGPTAGSGGQPLRDLATIRQAVAGPAITALFDAPWLPVAVMLAWLLHPDLAYLALGCAASLTALALANDILTRRLQQTGSRLQMEAQTLADAAVRKADTVLAMGMLPALMRRIARLHGDGLLMAQRAAQLGGLINGTTRSVRLMAQAGVMGLGTWLALDHTLSAGLLMAASILLSRALAPIEQMVGTWRSVTAARESWQRVQKLLRSLPPETPRLRLPAPVGLVTVEAAGVRTAEGLVLLAPLSLQLEPGEVLGIVGPSGSGKSTLCSLLAAVRRPTSGVVRLDGAELHGIPAEMLGCHVGFLAQEPMLFAGSVAENIARMAIEPDAEAVIEAAGLAGIHDWVLQLPRGYDTQLGDGGSPLSGGQRQRLGLARALYGAPRLLILDEPNASLDAAAEARLMTTLVQLKAAKVTTVVATHRMSMLRAADKLLVLEQGRATRFGACRTILAELSRPTRAA
jgi:PrtD family type I secretion system ABC transporter